METLLCTVHMVFSTLSVKKFRFEEMAWISEYDAASCTSINEVRWMSRHFAVKGLITNYETLIPYFSKDVENGNDPMAQHCVKTVFLPKL
jgi:hypothetical protein